MKWFKLPQVLACLNVLLILTFGIVLVRDLNLSQNSRFAKGAVSGILEYTKYPPYTKPVDVCVVDYNFYDSLGGIRYYNQEFSFTPSQLHNNSSVWVVYDLHDPTQSTLFIARPVWMVLGISISAILALQIVLMIRSLTYAKRYKRTTTKGSSKLH